MQMEMVIYGFQISPGHDDEMAFAASQEECQRECMEHRASIRAGDPVRYADLGAMAIYRYVVRQLGVEDFLAVLNDEARDLLARAVVDRRLVAVVVD